MDLRLCFSILIFYMMMYHMIWGEIFFALINIGIYQIFKTISNQIYLLKYDNSNVI